jgi:UPF0755 protein
MCSVKRMFLVLVVLFLLAAVAAGGFVFRINSLTLSPGPFGEDVELEVPKGANARTVGTLLSQTGLVPEPMVFRFAVWKRGGLSLKAGKFKLSRSLSPMELANALEKPPLAEDEPFVVVEGWRLRDVDEALAAAGRAEAGAYLLAASSSRGYVAPFELPEGTLEGYLYPETYMLPKGRIDPRVLVQKQLELFASRAFTPHESELRGHKRSLHELITMASMLEREEPNPTNRPMVAGILWKRIDLGYPLGVDATSRYELKEWNDRAAFLVKLRNVNDAYNTRHRKGLPPTPIGSPTEASFRAALEPTASEYLYYLHDAQRQLHPSRNAEEHEALRKKYDVY